MLYLSLVASLLSFSASHQAVSYSILPLDLYDTEYRQSYMSAHVSLNLLNELRKSDKMRDLPSILSLFRKEFNKFMNKGAWMLDSIYHMTLKLCDFM